MGLFVQNKPDVAKYNLRECRQFLPQRAYALGWPEIPHFDVSWWHAVQQLFLQVVFQSHNVVWMSTQRLAFLPLSEIPDFHGSICKVYKTQLL